MREFHTNVIILKVDPKSVRLGYRDSDKLKSVWMKQYPWIDGVLLAKPGRITIKLSTVNAPDLTSQEICELLEPDIHDHIQSGVLGDYS